MPMPSPSGLSGRLPVRFAAFEWRWLSFNFRANFRSMSDKDRKPPPKSESVEGGGLLLIEGMTLKRSKKRFSLKLPRPRQKE